MPALAKTEIAATEDFVLWLVLMGGGVAGRNARSKHGKNTQLLFTCRSDFVANYSESSSRHLIMEPLLRSQ
jgi:hypothetical protein